MGSQPPNAAIKGFWLVLFFLVLVTRMQMLRAVEAILVHQEVGRTIEKDLAPQLSRFVDDSNSSRRKEFIGKRRNVIKKQKEETTRERIGNRGP